MNEAFVKTNKRVLGDNTKELTISRLQDALAALQNSDFAEPVVDNDPRATIQGLRDFLTDVPLVTLTLFAAPTITGAQIEAEYARLEGKGAPVTPPLPTPPRPDR